VSVMEATDAIRTGEDVVIADAVRSPLGRYGPGGSLTDVRPSVLLAQVASALLDRTLLEPAAVTSVLIAGGLGFEDVARETCSLIGVAARPRAPLGPGSTQQSIIHTAARAVGTHDVVLVLGTTKPGSSETSRGLSRRGISAELVASWWKLSRAEVDAYAQQSRRRAREVAAMGEFGPEIIPAVAWSPESRVVIEADETIVGDLPPDHGGPLFYDSDIAHRYPERSAGACTRVMSAAPSSVPPPRSWSGMIGRSSLASGHVLGSLLWLNVRTPLARDCVVPFERLVRCSSTPASTAINLTTTRSARRSRRFHSHGSVNSTLTSTGLILVAARSASATPAPPPASDR